MGIEGRDKFSWKDSNVALFGSDEDKKVTLLLQHNFVYIYSFPGVSFANILFCKTLLIHHHVDTYDRICLVYRNAKLCFDVWFILLYYVYDCFVIFITFFFYKQTNIVINYFPSLKQINKIRDNMYSYSCLQYIYETKENENSFTRSCFYLYIYIMA